MKQKNKITIDNKKAGFNYTFIEEYTVGIVLKGCEIKSIRNKDVNMSDTYCSFTGNELFVRNLHISPYKNAGYTYRDYDPKRDRKILLRKCEIHKILQMVKTKGITIVPVKIFINESGLAKMIIAVAKGKHTYDKSKDIKERDLDREMSEYK